MKKMVSIALAAALFCATPLALSACGNQGGDGNTTTGSETSETASQDALQFATLGDVFAEDVECMSSTFDEQRYVCAFKWAGAWWLVEAPLADGMYDELNDAWVEDQNKVEELLSPLQVTKADVLEAPTVEEIEAYVGKTGADLSADGFTFMYGCLVVNGEQTDCTTTKGDFDYFVTFDGAVPDENTEDPAAAVAELTVADIGLQSVSWSTLEGE